MAHIHISGIKMTIIEDGKEVKLINLTPHPLNIIQGEDSLELPGVPLERAPRVEETIEEIGKIGDFPIRRKSLSKKIIGLPEPEDNTYFIVSSLVAQAAKDRRDLLVPAPVRNERGQVVGCDGFFTLYESLYERRNKNEA